MIEKGRRDYLFEVPRGTELADEGESRSKTSTPYTVGIGLGMFRSANGGAPAPHPLLPAAAKVNHPPYPHPKNELITPPHPAPSKWVKPHRNRCSWP